MPSPSRSGTKPPPTTKRRRRAGQARPAADLDQIRLARLEPAHRERLRGRRCRPRRSESSEQMRWPVATSSMTMRASMPEHRRRAKDPGACGWTAIHSVVPKVPPSGHDVRSPASVVDGDVGRERIGSGSASGGGAACPAALKQYGASRGTSPSRARRSAPAQTGASTASMSSATAPASHVLIDIHLPAPIRKRRQSTRRTGGPREQPVFRHATLTAAAAAACRRRAARRPRAAGAASRSARR